MLVFGHVGITTAVAGIIDRALPGDSINSGNGCKKKAALFINRFRDNNGNIDYRMVIIGSLLPDIIDKPLFLLLNNSAYFNGRGFSHSLMFSLILLGGGLIFRKSWLMALWFGCLMHLILDFMWTMPITLYWPFMGWFTPEGTEDWLENIWTGLISSPEVFIPEITGFLVMVYLAFRIIRESGVISFIKKGSIG